MPGVKNKRRLVGLLFVLLALMAVLLARVGYWSLGQSEWLQSQGEGQWTDDVAVAAKRGSILDRNGNVLAQSASADTVVLRPQKITDPDLVADTLSSVLGMDRQEIYDKATDTSKYEIWVKRQITRQQSSLIEQADLDGVAFTSDIKRYYPNNELATQVLGITTVDGEGLTGIEKEYDKYLKGKQGRIIAETDKYGTEIVNGNELYIEPVDGYNVVLTIDSVIQSYLEKACTEAFTNTNASSVQGIVMQPDTGQILGMANIQGYDLNDPPRSDAALLEELSRNKTTTDIYEPGSTFKILTLAAGLDSGAVTMDSTFECSGSYTVDGEKIKCWSANAHGHQSIYNAAQNSCNPAFMQMGLSMGTDVLYDYLEAFGLGEKTGIDYPSDQAGILINEKYVKNVDLARISFGQSVAVTPLQLSTAVSAAINGGYLYEPYLALRLEDSEGNVIDAFEPTMKRQVISEETSANVRSILRSVVDEGSGRNAQIEGYSVGGKTGTAQKYVDGKIADGLVIGSFIGFAPVEDPEFVVLILVDEPKTDVTYGSVVAAPYVKQVLEQTLKYANIPLSNIVDLEYAVVPDIVGYSFEEAEEILTNAGFKVSKSGTGEVASQLPRGKESAVLGSTVVLYGNEYYESSNSDASLREVPDVTGLDVNAAKKMIEDAGFEFVAVGSGIASRQEPAALSGVEAGSKVCVYFNRDLSYNNKLED